MAIHNHGVPSILECAKWSRGAYPVSRPGPEGFAFLQARSLTKPLSISTPVLFLHETRCSINTISNDNGISRACVPDREIPGVPIMPLSVRSLPNTPRNSTG
ncbi:hypothetical protein VTN02DRAFT_3182 [Thermoascus thermophilus]